ncbi:MAG: peptidylprolyl isomerase [Rhizobacter sp.]|nr:peptidylprolyl isomerase [Chlorobiales bacterium]
MSFLPLTACSDGGGNGELPVAEIRRGEQTRRITLGEFEEKYVETSQNIDAARKDSLAAYKEFLTRYVDFRLKVQDAYDRGMDKSPDVQTELKQYRDQLAGTYLTEKEVLDKNLRDLYEKRKVEVKASHILALASPDALPEDTLKAYRRIVDVIAQLGAGRSFDSLAIKNSDDPSARQNGGSLGYFTGGMMVYQFETAAFNTPVGGVSGPIRTKFGYHAIKVFDRRPKTQDIRASHILVRTSRTASPEDTLKAYTKIAGLLNAAKQGEDFAKLARENSEDPGSGQQGGDLNFFGVGRMVKGFEDAAFALKNIGDISPIIRTDFGYHIIKLTERKPLASFAEEKENLRSLLNRNTEKLEFENDQLAGRLKKTYGFEETAQALAAFVSKLDSNTTVDRVDSLRLSAADRQATMFVFAKQSYPLDSLLAHLKGTPQYRGQKLTVKSVKSFYDRYVKQTVLNYEISQLESRYSEFAKLMRDYKDGILLFKNAEEQVWSKATPTDSVAAIYFGEHKSEYQFGERVDISEIVVSSEATAAKIYDELTKKQRTLGIVTADSVKKSSARLAAEIKKLKRGDKDYKTKLAALKSQQASLKRDDAVRTFEQLAKRYTEKDSDTGRTGKAGLFQRDEYTAANAVFTQPVGFISTPQSIDGKFSVVRLNGKEAARPMTFEEAKPLAAAKYQEMMTKQLEEDWIKSLRTKSDVKYYDENLQKAFRTPAASTAMPSATAEQK